MDVVAVDIGGTHARFALAEVASGSVTKLGEAVTLKTVEHASLATAWHAFAGTVGRPLPRAASVAIACPIQGDVLKLTNNPWLIRPASLPEELAVDDLLLINDFGAVGHAVATMNPNELRHLAGPQHELPDDLVMTVVGPGTGLGLAQVIRRGGRTLVIETEGGHIDFAPLDAIEDAMLARLRLRYRRVSVERIVSGPGLQNVYEALAAIEGSPITVQDDKTLWQAALSGDDPLAVAAFERFCLTLGSIAGDYALAQGAGCVVLAGGVGQRIADRLAQSGFIERFVAKGRFEKLMASIPIKLITHDQPGLFGAAAAFAAR